MYLQTETEYNFELKKEELLLRKREIDRSIKIHTAYCKETHAKECTTSKSVVDATNDGSASTCTTNADSAKCNFHGSA